jgi:hypothetical protein
MAGARGLPGESVCSSGHMLSRGGRYEADPHAHYGSYCLAPGRAESRGAKAPTVAEAKTRAAPEAAKTGEPAAREVRDPLSDDD